MRVDRLWLSDFRSYQAAEFVPAPEGLTVVAGRNGEGKTNLLEAVGYLATLRSFRGVPGEALIRLGVQRAVVRAEVDHAGRGVLIEAELVQGGRDRVQVNRQPLRRARDLLGSFQVTVFSPDDLVLVKDGPAERRRYLDELLVALHPRHDATQTELDRVIRQRNALLKSVAGARQPPSDVLITLDVWDAKLAAVGEVLVSAREGLVRALESLAEECYAELADRGAGGAENSRVTMDYRRSWTGDLAEALLEARADDLRRGLTTLGPHRDELELEIDGMPARTHASQGEQRSLALALRLAGHQVVTGRLETAPVLLLDDVFSELDDDRSAALLRALPAGQALLTTAGRLPAGVKPETTWQVGGGKLWRCVPVSGR
jgi:DNA replication and repair protein RecF